MAWTTPKTWSSGETMDASELNQDLRDNPNHYYANQPDLYPTFIDAYKTPQRRSMWQGYITSGYEPWAQEVATDDETALSWNYARWLVHEGLDVYATSYVTWGNFEEYEPGQRFSPGYHYGDSLGWSGYGMLNVDPNYWDRVQTHCGTGIFYVSVGVVPSLASENGGWKIRFYKETSTNHSTTPPDFSSGSCFQAFNHQSYTVGVSAAYEQSPAHYARTIYNLSSVYNSTSCAWYATVEHSMAALRSAQDDPTFGGYGAGSRFQVYKLGEST